MQDRKMHFYVDRYGPVSVILFLAALLLSLLDAFITIRLLEAGGVELNPVMHFLLQFGEGPFLFVKFGCTAAALLILLIHKEYYFGRNSFRSRNLLALALAVYSLLIVYEFVLLSRI